MAERTSLTAARGGPAGVGAGRRRGAVPGLGAALAGGLFLGDDMGLASDGSALLPAFGQTGAADPADIYVRRFAP